MSENRLAAGASSHRGWVGSLGGGLQGGGRRAVFISDLAAVCVSVQLLTAGLSALCSRSSGAPVVA